MLDNIIIYVTGYISTFLLLGWFARHDIADWGRTTYGQLILYSLVSWLGVIAMAMMFCLATVVVCVYYIFMGITGKVGFLSKPVRKDA